MSSLKWRLDRSNFTVEQVHYTLSGEKGYADNNVYRTQEISIGYIVAVKWFVVQTSTGINSTSQFSTDIDYFTQIFMSSQLF